MRKRHSTVLLLAKKDQKACSDFSTLEQTFVHFTYSVVFVRTMIRKRKTPTLTSSLITPVASDVAFSERYLEEERN